MILDGIKVIELCANLAGPLVGTILGDLGAEVIKIERKEGGDDARSWAPPELGGKAASFQAINRNKASVALDLRDSGDMARLRRLIATADMLVHNMRPGTAEALGLGADEVRTINPAIIYCDMGAYGREGPLRHLPGYDALLQAFGGLMSVNGQPDGPPTLLGAAVIDKGTGMWTLIAALAALYRRAVTGRGAVIETSLLDTALSWRDMGIAMYQATGMVPTRQGNTSPLIVPYDLFETASGPVFIACAGDRLFRIFAQALGHPEWTEDERFATNPLRVKNKAALLPLIQEALRHEERDAVVKRLGDAGVPCAPILDTAEIVAHEQVRASGILQRPPGADFELVAAPFKIDGVRPPIRRGAPELGEDNARVLGAMEE